MVSIDLKGAYLQVPVHQRSRKYLLFVTFDSVFQFKVLVLRSVHRPSSFYKGRGSGFGHVAQSRRPDPSLSGRLTDSCLVESRGYKGKGHSFKSLPGIRHHHQFRLISPLSISDVYLPGNGDREPDCEGFPFSGDGTEASVTDRRISVVQAAKRRLLEAPVGPSVLSLSASPWRSSPNEISPADTVGRLGFSRRIGFDFFFFFL